MDRWSSLQAFVKVVESAGFAAAGRELGLSRAAVNKAVIDLERHLGAALLQRTTRRVAATEIGRAYYERAKAVLADLAEADTAVTRLNEAPRGTLKINAPMSFGALHLAPAITDFMLMHRELQVVLVLDDRFVDPVAEGFDVTLRIAALADSSLIARRIAPVRRLVAAAPDYLSRHGMPKFPEDLKIHRCLHYGHQATGNRWVFSGPDGEVAVPIAGALCSNNGDALREAAAAGLGLCLLPSFILGSDLSAGRLKAVLTDYETPPIALHAVYAPSRHLSAKVRLFVDFLVDRFARTPWEAGTARRL